MAAHVICFDFYYLPKPRLIGQNGSAAAADTRLNGLNTGHYKKGILLGLLGTTHEVHIVHYALLMMSKKESPRNHPWVLPKRVASLV